MEVGFTARAAVLHIKQLQSRWVFGGYPPTCILGVLTLASVIAPTVTIGFWTLKGVDSSHMQDFFRALSGSFLVSTPGSFPHRCFRSSLSLLGCAIFVFNLSYIGTWRVYRLCDTAASVRPCAHLLFSGGSGDLSDYLDLDLRLYRAFSRRSDRSCPQCALPKPHPVWRKLPDRSAIDLSRRFSKLPFHCCAAGLLSVSLLFFSQR